MRSQLFIWEKKKAKNAHFDRIVYQRSLLHLFPLILQSFCRSVQHWFGFGFDSTYPAPISNENSQANPYVFLNVPYLCDMCSVLAILSHWIVLCVSVVWPVNALFAECKIYDPQQFTVQCVQMAVEWNLEASVSHTIDLPNYTKRNRITPNTQSNLYVYLRVTHRFFSCIQIVSLLLHRLVSAVRRKSQFCIFTRELLQSVYC